MQTHRVLPPWESCGAQWRACATIPIELRTLRAPASEASNKYMLSFVSIREHDGYFHGAHWQMGW